MSVTDIENYISGVYRKFTKMKFFWTPPFLRETGKFDLTRSVAISRKSNFQGTRASYKPLHRREEPPKIEKLEAVQLPRTEEKRLSENEIQREELQRKSETPEVSGFANKKKKGVSGHSTEVTKSEKASDIHLPKYEKDEESQELIKNAIRQNEFLKNGLFASKEVIQAVVDATYSKSIAANTNVIREGEVGSHMFVCAKGTVEVFKGSKKVNTLGPGKLFGELALLYNSKRNATILAVTECSFWVLDRKDFLQIMKKSGMQMTENRVRFLRSVPFLSSLDTSILIKMTDLLKLKSFPGGTEILKQGDEASLFYIITGGTVSVTITQPDGSVKHGGILKAGDFFGEQALLNNKKRGATVTAIEPTVECLTLDGDHFIEYLGGLQEVQEVALDRKIRVEDNKKSEYDYVRLPDLEEVATLGIGAFGRVELVQLRKDKNVVFALKRVKKIDVVDLGQQEHMLNEKENMMICRSPFIVRMYNTFKSNKYLYFLMEACQGGDVWNLLQKRRFFDENLARFTTACMVEAFDYLHYRGIAYRDLKPENVLYDSKGYAKLADFGFSKKIGATSKTWTFAGTPEYVAPEIILNEGHNKAVDYWTLGIFVHELLVGKPPFRGGNHSKTYTLILRGIDSIEFPRHMSKAAQLLVKKLCKRQPAERLGYQREGVVGIKKHRWFYNFDWESLKETRMKAPFIPKLNGPTDMSNFDKYGKDKDIPPDELGDWDANF